MLCLDCHNTEQLPPHDSPEFKICFFKVIQCSQVYPHNWQQCPYAHAGERARRRDLRTHTYSSSYCPDVKKEGGCPRGDACPWSHNVFEAWLHPERFRTQMCSSGSKCTRDLCWFAHSKAELRTGTTAAATTAAGAAAAVSAFVNPSTGALQAASGQTVALITPFAAPTGRAASDSGNSSTDNSSASNISLHSSSSCGLGLANSSGDIAGLQVRSNSTGSDLGLTAAHVQGLSVLTAAPVQGLSVPYSETGMLAATGLSGMQLDPAPAAAGQIATAGSLFAVHMMPAAAAAANPACISVPNAATADFAPVTSIPHMHNSSSGQWQMQHVQLPGQMPMAAAAGAFTAVSQAPDAMLTDGQLGYLSIGSHQSALSASTLHLLLQQQNNNSSSSSSAAAVASSLAAAMGAGVQASEVLGAASQRPVAASMPAATQGMFLQEPLQMLLPAAAPLQQQLCFAGSGLVNHGLNPMLFQLC